MTDPLAELRAFETARRRANRWFERFCARLELKRNAKITAARAKLSPAAARLLSAYGDEQVRAMMEAAPGRAVEITVVQRGLSALERELDEVAPAAKAAE